MTIFIYEPRSMARALRQLPPAYTFLRQLCFRNEATYPTEKVDVDIQVGARKVAPFVNPHGPGKVIDRAGFTTATYTAPLVAPKRPITVEDIQTRLPGEHIYEGTDPVDREAELLGRDLQELDTMIVRRVELMCRDAIISSAIVVSGDDVSYTITFPRDANLVKGVLAAADRWDAATADIYGQILGWILDMQQYGFISPNFLIMGSDVVRAFMANADNQAKLNVLRMQLGQIAPELRGNGSSYLGEFAGTGVDLWAYNEWYEDAVGTTQPMIPAKGIVMGSTLARTELRYGAVAVKSGEGSDATIGMVRAARVPESWVDREPPVRWAKLSSRPLPVPIQNTYLTATVLV